MAEERVTYVGHGSVLLELGGLRLLTDPLLRPRFLHARRVAPPPPADLLDGLDGVLISHLHMDHLNFASLRGLDRETPMVVPAGGGRVLRRRGFRDVTELRPGDETAAVGIPIRATEAEHDGRRWPVGPAVEALGYVVGGASRVYFAGDTDLHSSMEDMAGDIDVALLPIAGWGPKVGNDGHLDGRSAAEAVARIRPRLVIPIHWGTYMRSDLISSRPELLIDPPLVLAEELARLAPEAELMVLAPGEAMVLGPDAQVGS